MKKNFISLIIILASTLTACDDWLTAPQPGVTMTEDFYSSGDAAIQNITACYVPLQWEYSSTYCCEWFIGDVVSDDALKGGQSTNDMSDVYDMENWKTATNNTLLHDFYKAQYQGIARCNMALENIPNMDLDSVMTQNVKNRLIGEAKFLRAYYYFRLVRVFGGVPKVDHVIGSDAEWQQARASVAEIYDFILSDLEDAQKYLWKKSEYADEDMGRATKGAAQAMLMKANLYFAGDGNAKYRNGADAAQYYQAAKAWGDSIIASGEYSLCPNYADNFTLAGENGPESVFEIQYVEDPTSDYGEGFGFTRGTFAVILTRSRSSMLGGGWGFNKPTQNLYDEYETGDTRRDVTILNPNDTLIENPAQEIYLGSRYISRKYALYNDDLSYYTLTHATRGPINNKQIRYADVLLMYAEACEALGNESEAKAKLNEVRQRQSVNLPAYPGYTLKINGEEISNPTLRQAIRHERRMELAMEGHRWFDLCRWGVAEETMNAYRATESQEAQDQMATFIAGKHELFPIPDEEIELNPLLEQNPGY